MNPIYHRYGASFKLPVELDDNTATLVELVIGKAGEEPKVTISATPSGLTATLEATREDMRFPLGEYSYQFNLHYSGGRVEKYPTITNYSAQLPSFFLEEALDETEVTA